MIKNQQNFGDCASTITVSDSVSKSEKEFGKVIPPE